MAINKLSEDRSDLAGILECAACGNDPVIIERPDAPPVAVISMEDLALLRRLKGSPPTPSCVSDGNLRDQPSAAEPGKGRDVAVPDVFTSCGSEPGQHADDLLMSEARLKAILDNAPTMIYLKDVNGRYVLINRLFERT
jgi:PAS domain-containing protein